MQRAVLVVEQTAQLVSQAEQVLVDEISTVPEGHEVTHALEYR